MRKILCITLSFVVCRFLDVTDIWTGFTLVTLGLMLKLNPSLLWEIPIGVLSCSIVTDVFYNDMADILRVIIPTAAVLMAYSAPRKLILPTRTR